MLQVTYATLPAPGCVNEDYVLAGPSWVVVLDGATARRGVDSGCAHDVPWLVRTLAAGIAARMEAERPLREVLSDSVLATMDCHGDACDLANPNSPSATVAMLRRTGHRLDYLVLCDSPIVIQRVDGDVVVIDDDRAERLPGGRPYSQELVERSRNRPGGFWVASTRPEAAFEAVSGSIGVEVVRGVGMVTDGVSRLVSRYGRTWEQVVSLLDERGPAAVLAAVRREEHADGVTRPGKPHDDATAVWARPHDG